MPRQRVLRPNADANAARNRRLTFRMTSKEHLQLHLLSLAERVPVQNLWYEALEMLLAQRRESGALPKMTIESNDEQAAA
ncbi:hypothetical protein [Bradyrhizobium sp. F1.13.3]|uniref:hypothetical protein n=1 Tax=Bradyrhizobium sp. F1.13.3 TaxID=3156351 RepID=UPI0033930A2F